MHAARAIRTRREQQAPAQTLQTNKPNRFSQSPEGGKEAKNGRRSPGTDSTLTITDEKPGFKGRVYSRNSSEGSSFYSYDKSNRKIEPVVWGKCFCFIGVVVTILGLILLLVGMTSEFRPTPFVFGVFCTIAGILVLMFGICFVKAAEHWPEYNRSRVGSVFIISDEVSKKEMEEKSAEPHDENDMVKVLTVQNAPRLEFINEGARDTAKELPGAVNRGKEDNM